MTRYIEEATKKGRSDLEHAGDLEEQIVGRVMLGWVQRVVKAWRAVQQKERVVSAVRLAADKVIPEFRPRTL
jgi:hypothetical protein